MSAQCLRAAILFFADGDVDMVVMPVELCTPAHWEIACVESQWGIDLTGLRVVKCVAIDPSGARVVVLDRIIKLPVKS